KRRNEKNPKVVSSVIVILKHETNGYVLVWRISFYSYNHLDHIFTRENKVPVYKKIEWRMFLEWVVIMKEFTTTGFDDDYDDDDDDEMIVIIFINT
ncbi:hypothetical protein DERP_008937, partial [Dermatophagoides pteronyssinus]